MATVRRSLGFQRYLLSLQYHGSSFLGFSYQGENQENNSNERSVEGCLRHALESLFSGHSNWENIQVSSRTDRGVHALKNTCHVDIKQQTTNSNWTCEQIHRGLNYYLLRQEVGVISKKRRLGERIDRRNELRVLRVLQAPEQMPNPWADAQNPTQPSWVDWNARFSATQRTYVYRILHSHGRDRDWMVPFEWDRAWRIHSDQPFDVNAVQRAAEFLVGEHDFSSFRGKGCQRSSPIVNLAALRVNFVDYNCFEHLLLGAVYPVENHSLNDCVPGSHCQLVTFLFQGNSFLYRQVRNLTGCLVEVGRGRLKPDDIPALLAARNRARAPVMAPPHGLFLVDVQHQGIRI